MPSKSEQLDNVISLDAKRRSKHLPIENVEEPIDFGQEKFERKGWPVMKRSTAGAMIGLAGVLTAFGMGQNYENQQRIETGDEIVAERNEAKANMTDEELVAHRAQEAANEVRQRQAYEQAQRPDGVAPAVVTEQNGSERGEMLDSDQTIPPEISKEPQVIEPTDKLGEGVGRYLGDQ